MSLYKVPLTTIKEIKPDPNPEVLRLEIAVIYGFEVVVKKDSYKVGDSIIYIPVDSIIPSKLETILFPKDSKIKLDKQRVRQIRIQKFPSQGMIFSIEDYKKFTGKNKIPKLETDLAEELGITKYEPPFTGPSSTIGKGKQRNKKDDNPLFHKYNSLDNIKWHPDLFQPGQEVLIEEKLHGSNCRMGLLPYNATTLKKKILKFLRLAPKYEKCYGSNNVEISSKSNYTGFYGEDIYGKVFDKIKAFDKIKPNETIFGEIIGPGIQKNYDYGLKEHHFVLFDVKVLQKDGSQKWMNPEEVENYAKERGFDFVPVLYRGPFDKDLAYSLTKGDSVYCPSQKVREGIVIKDRYNYSVDGNKMALKWINEDYLDNKTNTDFH